MTTNDVPDRLEDTGGVEQTVANLLLDEVRVEKLPQKRDVREVLLKLWVLWGRWEEQLRGPRAGRLWRLDDRHEHLEELVEQGPYARRRADGHHTA